MDEGWEPAAVSHEACFGLMWENRGGFSLSENIASPASCMAAWEWDTTVHRTIMSEHQVPFANIGLQVWAMPSQCRGTIVG